MLTMNDIMEYKENKNFNYLVIESSHGEYYGFNLKVKKERSYVTKIVSPDERDDFMVVGWKVAKKLPKWICNANSWIDFISGKEDDENKQGADNENGKEDSKEEEAVEEKKGVITEDKELGIDNYEVEEEEDNDEEEEEEDNKEEEEEKKVGEEEEEEGDAEEEEEEEVEEEVEEDEEEKQEEEVEGDSVDGNSAPNQKKSSLKKVINKRNNSNTSNQKKKTPKKVNDKKTNKRNNSKSDDHGEVNNTTFKCDNNDKDVSIFNSICGNFLKKEVAKNVKLSMKTDIVDIFITGPFPNAKTGKSYWIVVYGDYGSAWTLKSQFIKGYIGTLLTKIKKPTIDIGHSSSYYDINIRKYEFGKESV